MEVFPYCLGETSNRSLNMATTVPLGSGVVWASMGIWTLVKAIAFSGGSVFIRQIIRTVIILNI